MSDTPTPTWIKLFTLAFNGPTFYRHEPSGRVALCAQPEPPADDAITWLDLDRPLSMGVSPDREWGYIPVFKPNSDEHAYAYAWVYHLFQLSSSLRWPVVAHNRVFRIDLMQPDAQSATPEGDEALRAEEEAMIAAAIAAAQAPMEFGSDA